MASIYFRQINTRSRPRPRPPSAIFPEQRFAQRERRREGLIRKLRFFFYFVFVGRARGWGEDDFTMKHE